jgi:hypothetical protein
MRLRPPPRPVQALLLLAVASGGPAAAAGGFITNSATSEATSILSGKSGENMACDNGAWKTVDGDPEFGCDGATPGQLGRKVAGWNGAPPTGDEWLTFDFKKPVTLVGLRYSGGGDKIHDADEMSISIGPSKDGPWQSVGKFSGKEGAGKANQWHLVWQSFSFSDAQTSQHWKWTIHSRHSQWQVWVGEVQFEEQSAWGWWLIGLLVFGSAGYFGGGALYNRQTRGLRGAAAVPSRRELAGLAALVVDGLELTKARLRGRPVGPKGLSVGGGNSAGLSKGGPKQKEKKEKKEKKKKKKKAKMPTGSHPDAGAAGTTSEQLVSVETVEAERAQPEGTAAGGGGRWVHQTM